MQVFSHLTYFNVLWVKEIILKRYEILDMRCEKRVKSEE
jgi:hypothetical protein